MSYIIGIDAGGTKTHAVIIDQHKNILFSTEAGFGNVQVDFLEAANHLWEALSNCLNSEYGPDCHIIVAGIAGIETKDHRANMEQFLQGRTPLPIILVNDAVMAYHAALGNQEGILTIAGTGSISYGRKGNMEAYTGGWGHLIGDEGSSYHIVLQAFRKIKEEADMAIVHSCLSQVLMKEIGAVRAEEIKGFIYKANKGEIAALSLTIFKEAEKGNQLAKQYFYQAGKDLAKQTILLSKRLQLQAPLKVAMKGSLLEKNVYVQSSFKKSLSAAMDTVEWFCDTKNMSATGAYTLVPLYGGPHV